MGTIAFLFSGQGDQFPGMGKDLYETSPAAKAVFDACEALRSGTLEQCFRGSREELTQTVNTQPCLYAMELAAVAALGERGIRPQAAAGFSLGEICAAAAAGLYDLETGFRLVCRRGELMHRAAQAEDTAMMAVVKLRAETVENLCRNYRQVYPVNYNCPGQITVSGLAEQMTGFAADVKAAGGRGIPLKVAGGFHSPFMEEAARAFAGELAAVSLRQPAIDLYSNLTAQIYTGDAAGLLARQIASPVRWEELIRNMARAGVDTFLEVGPGKTLSNMVKKILPQARIFCTAELQTLISEVTTCSKER